MIGGNRCRVAVADLLEAPDADARRTSQCLFGERVDVLGRSGDWCRVRLHRDGYVGHLHRDALGGTSGGGTLERRATTSAETLPCRIGVRATLLFARPDIKSPVRLRVPFGAELDRLPDAAADDGDGGTVAGSGRGGAPAVGGAAAGGHGASRFARVRVTLGGGRAEDVFVWRDHCLAPDETLAGEPVDIARRLYDGAPYLWGGRTPDGADCSGLLQGAALALGLALPRDSGEQESALRHLVHRSARAASDVVFWPGHVGLLIDPDTLFHATAHTLSTAVEPLAAVIARAGEPSSIRRLPALSRPADA